MPLYDMKCSRCEKEEAVYAKLSEIDQVRCMECDESMRVLITMRSKHVAFKEGYYDNITDFPIHCSSPQELRDACDEYDGKSVYLEDSSFKTAPGEGMEKWNEKHPKGRLKRKMRKPLSSYRVHS